MSRSLVALAMVLSTLCYGIAVVLQARAARSRNVGASVGPRFLIALVRRPAYLCALALNAVGFIAQVPALRTFPLFVVQTAQAANLAVAAILAIPLLRERLRPRDCLAIIAVISGLSLLLVSTSTLHYYIPDNSLRFELLLWAASLAIMGYFAEKFNGPTAGAVLGFIAGLAFGTVGLTVRFIQDPSVVRLISDPVTYALLLSGLIAFVLYAVALKRSTVTVATASLIIAQLGGSILVGMFMLGDRARVGYGLDMIVGMAIAIIGAVSLARFASVSDLSAG